MKSNNFGPYLPEDRTFEELYPNAPYSFQLYVEGDEVFRSNKEGSCICDKKTYWRSISFMDFPYCSVICLRLEWKRFIEIASKPFKTI